MPNKLKAILGTAGAAGVVTLAATVLLARGRGLGPLVELAAIA
ncbi:MAG: hypothetical protein QOD57_962, partial [Actinomycetota bacterium]|nr:hypothetical protein [Actinomycetota bacterium]